MTIMRSLGGTKPGRHRAVQSMLSLLLGVTLVLAAFAPIVQADVLFYPPNNFFENHIDECTRDDHSYYVNSRDGYVYLRRDPASSLLLGSAQNGDRLFVYYHYEYRGESWGLTEVDDDTGNGAWVAMGDLVAVYTYETFASEHEYEFREFDGQLEDLGLGDDVVLYTWPGSGSVFRGYGYDPYDWRPLYTYDDASGRQWLALGFMYPGIDDAWMCLDDPSNPSITAFNPSPEIGFYPAVEPNVPKVDPLVMISCVIGVTLLVAASIVLMNRSLRRAQKLR
jgi:hypothetical protein